MGFERAKIVLASHKKGGRQIIKTILENMGFTHIVQGTDVDDMMDILRNHSADLLIVDQSFPHHNITDLIKNIRNNSNGVNPFLPIITLTDEPTPKLVSDAINCGVDDLFIQPYTMGQFVSRIEAIVDRRKPFVVTSDYIGPDRRQQSRPQEGMEVPRLDVPNSLRSRVKDEMDEEAFNASVASTFSQINLLKLNRNGDQVQWLVDQILKDLRAETDDHLDASKYLMRLIEVARETKERVTQTPYAHLGHVCDSLMDLSDKMILSLHNPEQKDQLLLVELGKAFHVSFKDAGQGDLAKFIQQEASKVIH